MHSLLKRKYESSAKAPGEQKTANPASESKSETPVLTKIDRKRFCWTLSWKISYVFNARIEKQILKKLEVKSPELKFVLEHSRFTFAGNHAIKSYLQTPTANVLFKKGEDTQALIYLVDLLKLDKESLSLLEEIHKIIISAANRSVPRQPVSKEVILSINNMLNKLSEEQSDTLNKLKQSIIEVIKEELRWSAGSEVFYTPMANLIIQKSMIYTTPFVATPIYTTSLVTLAVASSVGEPDPSLPSLLPSRPSSP